MNSNNDYAASSDETLVSVLRSTRTDINQYLKQFPVNWAEVDRLQETNRAAYYELQRRGFLFPERM